MRIARVCFILAGLSGVCATALAGIYPNTRCLSTPINPPQCSCGCPVPNTPGDLCVACVEDPGQPATTNYYCGGTSGTCSAPNYGCGDQVYFCPNCTCVGPWGSSCVPADCNPTDKQGFCSGGFGCSNI